MSQGTSTPKIRNSSIRSHASEGEIALEIASKIASVNEPSVDISKK